MRPLVLLALLATASASAQAPAESLPPRPPLSVPFEGDFEPLQTSAPLAVVYSIAATGGLVAVGLLVNEVVSSSMPESDRPFGLTVPALVLIQSGLMLGPSVGNFTLGAARDVNTALKVKLYGMGIGAAISVVGLLLIPAAVIVGSPDVIGHGAFPLLQASLYVAGAAVGAGAVYDLVTIPRNAALARRYRRQYGAALVPTIDVRTGTAGLALRVAF